MKIKRSILVLVGVFLILTFSAETFPQQVPPKPQIIRWANYDIGASAYVMGMAIAEGMLKKHNIKLRMLPLGSGIGRMMAVRTKTSDIFISAADAVYARRGTEDWAVREWGPQPIRTAWMVKRRSTFAVVTRGDSGVKKLEDLKGRKVAYIVGSPSLNAAVEGALSLVNLTWNDVQKVEYPSLTAGYNSVKDGKTDAVAMASASPVAYEMEASPSGIYWIPYPKYEENKKGWETFEEIYPGTFPGLVTKGAGISEKKPVYTSNFPFPNLFTYDFVDESLIYWQVRSIVESYEIYKDMAPDMPYWSLDDCLSLPLGWAPWHEGAIRYFKEIGKWTKQMQAAQDKLMAIDKKHKEIWEAALDESVEKKIKGKDFTKFWLEKRAAAGFR